MKVGLPTEREIRLTGIANRTYAMLRPCDRMRMQRRCKECAEQTLLPDYCLRHLSNMLAFLGKDKEKHDEYIEWVKGELYDIYKGLPDDHKTAIRKRMRGKDIMTRILLFPEELITKPGGTKNACNEDQDDEV